MRSRPGDVRKHYCSAPDTDVDSADSTALPTAVTAKYTVVPTGTPSVAAVMRRQDYFDAPR